MAIKLRYGNAKKLMARSAENLRDVVREKGGELHMAAVTPTIGAQRMAKFESPIEAIWALASKNKSKLRPLLEAYLKERPYINGTMIDKNSAFP